MMAPDKAVEDEDVPVITREGKGRARDRKMGWLIGTRCGRRDDNLNKSNMVANRWLDMSNDVMIKVFTILDPLNLYLVVPLVCMDWGSVFYKQYFCIDGNNCLDFSKITVEPFAISFNYDGDNNSQALKLMHLLVGIMHAFGSDGLARVTSIKFPDNIPMFDRHLVYVAKRFPNLKKLVFPSARNITWKGIAKAMRYWSQIETIEYGSTVKRNFIKNENLYRTIEIFGNCKNLRLLHLCGFELQWVSAAIIAQNLKYVRILSLEYVEISKYGLQILLSRCKKNIQNVLISSSCHKFSTSLDLTTSIFISRKQEGRRTKWYSHIGGLCTTKELVNSIWKL